MKKVLTDKLAELFFGKDPYKIIDGDSFHSQMKTADVSNFKIVVNMSQAVNWDVNNSSLICSRGNVDAYFQGKTKILFSVRSFENGVYLQTTKGYKYWFKELLDFAKVRCKENYLLASISEFLGVNVEYISVFVDDNILRNRFSFRSNYSELGVLLLNNCKIKYVGMINRNSLQKLVKIYPNEHEAKFEFEGYKLARVKLNSISNLKVDMTPCREAIVYDYKSLLNSRPSLLRKINIYDQMGHHEISANSIQWMPFWDRVVTNIGIIKSSYSNQEVVRYLEDLKNAINIEQEIPLSFIYGAFGEERLCWSDFSFSRRNYPLLYDVFDQEFGKLILRKSFSIQNWKKSLKSLLKKNSIDSLVKRYKVDVELHYKLFLLIKSSYLLAKSTSEEIETSVIEALIKEFALKSSKEQNNRIVLNDLRAKLVDVQYAFVNFYEESIDRIGEHCILTMSSNREVSYSILRYLKSHPLVKDVEIQYYGGLSSAYIEFFDGTSLILDLVTELCLNGKLVLDMRPILTTATINKFGVKVPELKRDFEYAVLTHQLNRVAMSEQLTSFFTDCFNSNYSERNRTVRYLEFKLNIEVINISAFFIQNEAIHNNIISMINSNNNNSLLSTLIGKFKSSRIGEVIQLNERSLIGNQSGIQLVLSRNLRYRVIDYRTLSSYKEFVNDLRKTKVNQFKLLYRYVRFILSVFVIRMQGYSLFGDDSLRNNSEDLGIFRIKVVSMLVELLCGSNNENRITANSIRSMIYQSSKKREELRSAA